MPHVARYFSQRAYDSSFEPCLKKSKVDYSALCKKRNTEEFIPLQSEKGSSPGYSGNRYHGSGKDGCAQPRASDNFLIGLENEAKPGSSRNEFFNAHSSKRAYQHDYLALGEKKNTDEYVQLEPKESFSGFSETRYCGSDKGEYEKPGGKDFLNSLESGSSRDYSSEAHSSRESKPDYSALCKKSNTAKHIPLDTQSEECSSRFSEARSDKGKHDNSGGSKDFLNDLDSQAKTESSGKYSPEAPSRRESKTDPSALCKKSNIEEYIPLEAHGEREKPRESKASLNGLHNESKRGPCLWRDDGNKKQQIFEVHKREKLENSNSETKFSETSTAFIGPLYRPPPQVGSVSLTTHNESRKSPSFRTTMVVSGKAANKAKSEDGMNYELGQFYKELYELEVATDDPHISPTAAHSQQDFSSHQSNAPIVRQVGDLYGQQDFRSHQSSAPLVHQIRDHHSPHDFHSHQSSAPIVHQVRDHHGQQDFSFHQRNAPMVPQVRDHHGQQDFSSHQRNAPMVHQFRDHHSQQDFSFHQRNAPIVPQVRDNHGQQDFSSHQRNASIVPQVRDNHGQRDFSFHQRNAPMAPQVRDNHGQPDFSFHQRNAPMAPQVRDHHGQQDFSSHQRNAPMLHQFRDHHSQQDFSSHQDNTSIVHQVRDHHGQQDFSSCQSNTPMVHQFRDHQSQTSSSQPCNPLPSKQSAPIFPSYHPNEPPVSPAECDRPVPFDRTNSSFVNCSLPPPGFRCPPPPTFVGPPYGPPPPRNNHPLPFPRGDDKRNSTYHENEKYHSGIDNLPRPTTQIPWHSTPVPPDNRFSPQGGGHKEPFPRPPLESSQQSSERDFCEQKGSYFKEVILPQGGNVPHEQYPPRFRDEANCTEFKGKLVLLRGVPGSGKSTLARILLDQSPDGIVLSTDDYFCQENGYAYDVKLLGDAHSWNQNRALRAMEDGKSPIIIDNTNIQGWEMKPYVQMAIERCYGVDFLEPDTWWKLDPHELEKKNTHRVPREKISQMLERFEHGMNVGVVMNSVEPRRVRSRPLPPEDRPRWGASMDCTQHSTSFQIR